MKRVSGDDSRKMPQFELGKDSSSKELIDKLLDYSEFSKPKIGKKDPIDEDFLQKVQALKRGRFKQAPSSVKKHYQQGMVDMMMMLEKVEKNLHHKIDENLLPQKKKQTYLDIIKPIRPQQENGKSPNKEILVGMRRITRFKVFAGNTSTNENS